MRRFGMSLTCNFLKPFPFRNYVFIILVKIILMKKSILVFFVFFAALTGVQAQQSKTKKAVIQTFFNCDHCKMCETCGKNFQTNLYKIDGLKMYEIDEKKMTITVFFNSNKTDLIAIKTAISKLGFDADDIKADVAAYEKLDGCCKA